MDEYVPETEEVCEVNEEYLSVAEAARLLGVSPRTLYGYVDEGKLEGERIENRLMVKAQAVRTFKRRAPGRIRTTAPHWRVPPVGNRSYLTTITARVRPGQGKQLEKQLGVWRRERKHLLLGTAARYVVRNQARPEEVIILLLWREGNLPTRECREAALAALGADLAEVVEWETAQVKEGKVLLQA